MCENNFGPLDNGGRHTRQLGDVNTVTAVGTAAHDLMHEHNFILIFTNSNIIINDARQLMFQLNQFMIMGGEQCFGFDGSAVMQIFDHRPGDG